MLKISGEIEMREDEMFGIGAAVGFIVAIVLGFVACISLAEAKNKSLRAEAIRTGHAEYVVDERGKTTFKFKD